MELKLEEYGDVENVLGSRSLNPNTLLKRPREKVQAGVEAAGAESLAGLV